MGDVGGLLRSLLAICEETAQVLDQEELDLDRVTDLFTRRNELFARLQNEIGAPTDIDPEHTQIVQQILALDRTCMEAVRSHMTRMQGELSDVKLRQRTMKAYGWVDPQFAVRGAFVDYKGR